MVGHIQFIKNFHSKLISSKSSAFQKITNPFTYLILIFTDNNYRTEIYINTKSYKHNTFLKILCLQKDQQQLDQSETQIIYSIGSEDFFLHAIESRGRGQ